MTSARAGVYVRISEDRDEDEEGVDRQERDCRDLAARLGWTIAEIYTENDTSAFKRRKVRLPDGTVGLRVVRSEFRRMLDDLASGTINAVVGYDLDRVARDPRDLEDLIDVVEQNHIPNRAVTGSLDLSTDSGITMARVMVAVANKSSRDSSRRITRKHADLAEDGRPGGGGVRPYGYDRDGMTVIEEEAAVIRDIAARILDGQTVNSIANSLTRGGVPTVKGGARGWHFRSVHSAVSKPRVAGLREYKGEIVGEATWPAILDRETWEQVRLALEGRRRSGSSFRHWLRGVLVCHHCKARMVGWGVGKRPSVYWCSSLRQHGGCGQTSIVADRAQETVEAMILAFLTRPDVLARLSHTSSTESVQRARSEIKADENQLLELAGMWGRRELPTPEYLAARREIEARMKRWKSVVSGSVPASVRRLLAAEDIPAAWVDLVPTVRREVARTVFPLGIEVLPGGPGPFKPERLRPIED